MDFTPILPIKATITVYTIFETNFDGVFNLVLSVNRFSGVWRLAVGPSKP